MCFKESYGIYVPNLRFKGFEGEWESKRLGEVCEINPKNESLSDLFIYIDLESVANGRLLKEDYISKDEAPSRAQRILAKNDVLFQMVRPYQKNNLFFDKEGEYVASTGYAQIRTNQNSQFIFQHLHNQKFVDKVIERCTGTSYPAINSTDLGNIHIHYPNFGEQQKIASFLSLIDERITTQNKIIEELEVLKTAIAKKIFSQQLRFKDDNGSDFPKWKVKKLGDLGVFFSGGTPLTTNKGYFNGDIPFIKSGEINSDKTEQYLSEEGLKNSSAKMVKTGDLIYALYGATSGEVGISKINGAINQAVLCIRTSINNIFLMNYLILQKESILKTYLQGGQGNLSTEIVKSLKVFVPNIEEQCSIANFLTSIDKKVNIETQLLQKLEEQKKFLLQNLFV